MNWMNETLYGLLFFMNEICVFFFVFLVISSSIEFSQMEKKEKRRKLRNVCISFPQYCYAAVWRQRKEWLKKMCIFVTNFTDFRVAEAKVVCYTCDLTDAFADDRTRKFSFYYVSFPKFYFPSKMVFCFGLNFFFFIFRFLRSKLIKPKKKTETKRIICRSKDERFGHRNCHETR